MELTEAYRLNDTLIKKYFPDAGRGYELGLGKDDAHHYWLKSEAEMKNKLKEAEDFYQKEIKDEKEFKNKLAALLAQEKKETEELDAYLKGLYLQMNVWFQSKANYH